MASSNLSSTTFKIAMSDLRSRIAQVTNAKVIDEELVRWLNVAQQITATKLSSICNHWYEGKEESIATAYTADAVTALNLTGLTSGKPSLVTRYNGMVCTDGTGTMLNKVFRNADSIEDIYSKIGSANDAYSVFWYHLGENMLVYVGASLTTTTCTSTLFFTRKTIDVTMANIATYNLDIPTEYVDLAILKAQSIALGKLDMLDKASNIDRYLMESYQEIENQYGKEAQQSQIEQQPGKQTPRGR